MFEDIVDQLGHSYQGLPHYSVTPLPSARKGSIAAVDGGAALLWSNTVQSIGVVTAGYIVYDEHHKITHHKIRQQEILLQGEDIDLHRFQLELTSLAEAAEVCDCVLFDGALQDIPNTKFKEVITSLDETITVMGISKKTRLDTLQKGVPDTETLHYSGKWYYKITDSKVQPFKPLGEIYIARLHERGPPFRIDVKGSPQFDMLAYFSRYLFCLGYPYPLMEIHKATTLRDKKVYYQTELQKAMAEKGLEREYLSGVYHLEREREEFHQILDGLV